MIEKLTKKQESLLSIYRDKWLDVGLSTDRINLVEAIKIYSKFNKEVFSLWEKSKDIHQSN